MTPQLVAILGTALGGVGVFLLGMRLMSEGLQALAGERLHRWISAATGNRLAAVLIGIGVTALVQSSTATTVMVVGFVNSGLMGFTQGLAVVFGAHVGTTLSLWLLTLNIAQYGGFAAGTAVFAYLFSKNEKIRLAGMAAMGLGMLFFGLELLAEGFAPLREMESLKAALAFFRADSTWGFLMAASVGAAATALIHSSAAMVVLVMGLAGAQAIDFATAVAPVLGSNVGTTFTALVACIGASRAAVRTALGNTLMNLTAVLLITLFRVPFTAGCERFVLALRHFDASDPASVRAWFTFAIACVHTLFNVSATILFFPFLGWFAKGLERLVPVRASEQPAGWRPRFLDPHVLDRPAIALGNAQREILAMGEACLAMLADLKACLAAPGDAPEAEERVFRTEAAMDLAQKGISEYIGQALHGQGNITSELAALARRGIRQADEFESFPDYIRNALKSHRKIRAAGETLTPAAVAEVVDLCDRIDGFARMVQSMMVVGGGAEAVALAETRSREIDEAAKRYRTAHMERIGVSCLTPMKSLVYSDLLVAFRRQNDHLLNIAQTLA